MKVEGRWDGGEVQGESRSKRAASLGIGTRLGSLGALREAEGTESRRTIGHRLTLRFPPLPCSDVVIVTILLKSFEGKIIDTVLERNESSVLPVYLGL